MEESEASSLNTSSGIGTYLVIGLILAAIAGGIVYMARNSGSEEMLAVASPTITPTIVETPQVSSTATELALGETLILELKGDKFRYSQDTIQVKKGQKIKVELTSVDMPHDFVIDELAVKSQTAAPGKTVEVEFTADKVGEFEYYCSVGNHRQMGMVGKLTVTE